MKKARWTFRVSLMRGDRTEDKTLDAGIVISTAIYSEWKKGVESWGTEGSGSPSELWISGRCDTSCHRTDNTGWIMRKPHARLNSG